MPDSQAAPTAPAPTAPAPTGPAPNPQVLSRIVGQPKVVSFLSAAVRERRLSHAYLFVGAPGAGTLSAAFALAQTIVCPTGGDGTCDECIRVAHRSHPDVHYLAPQSVTGYLVDQVRDLIDDVALAPVRVSRKVYILDRAELLRAASANALLKTLEEPPAGVVFILVARSVESMLPTVASRCQVVPFDVLPPEQAEYLVELSSGVTGTDARVALAVAGSPEAAAEYLGSNGRREVRRLVVRTVGELAHDDAWDVLVSARSIVEAVKAPLADVKSAQEAVAEQNADFLTPATLRQLEERQKRELTARERSGMMEALAAAESLLRDVLARREGAGTGDVNEDVSEVIDRLARTTGTPGVLQALDAIRRAKESLSAGVTPQLALEVMFLGIKEALACPSPSSR